MGFMDKLSGMLGGNKKAKTDTVKGPSAELKERGIDPSDLKFAFHADGTLGVSGEVQTKAEADKIVKVLAGITGVTGVDNKLLVAPATPEPTPVVEADAAPPEAVPEVSVEAAEESPASADVRTYTVKSGDTLWAVAEEMYGSGAKYKKIFEANTDQLENPDKIRPGQVLVIPDLDD